MIQGEMTQDLERMYSSRDQRLQGRGDTISSFDIQKNKSKINGQADLLTNMINFLVLLLNELEV